LFRFHELKYDISMHTLQAMVLAALSYLHPGARSAPAIATAIAAEVSRTCVEPGALGSCALDAVTMGVLAEAEGGLCVGTDCKRGDHGTSAGTFQVMGYSPEQTELYERDLVSATRQAYAVVRAGAAQCPEERLAPYCGGCSRRGARALARPRLAIARGLLEIVAPAASESLDEVEGQP
jgi:hypothetical protein